MDHSETSMAKRIAQTASAWKRQATGRLPGSVNVVLREGTLVTTLHGTFSQAETALAKTREGATQLREFHRQLFAAACEYLRREIAERCQSWSMEFCIKTEEKY